MNQSSEFGLRGSEAPGDFAFNSQRPANANPEDEVYNEENMRRIQKNFK